MRLSGKFTSMFQFDRKKKVKNKSLCSAGPKRGELTDLADLSHSRQAVKTAFMVTTITL